MTRIAAAVLAAGASRRLGEPKQVLPFRGTLLVRAIAKEMLGSSCAHVAVVLGAHAGIVAPALADLPVATLSNVLWSEGIASSIRCAAAWTMQLGCDALALVTCDQYRLTAAHVDRLCSAHRRSGRSIGSRYAGIVGIPAVFATTDLPSLLGLGGDTGARRLLRESIAWPAGADDLDTPDRMTALRSS
jgi:CTP:molybdopterin cytidylyltransferase MocA